MRMRTVLISVFALVFGVSAAGGVFLMMGATPEVTMAESVSVVVATMDINRGQTLAAEHLEMRDWPKEMVPDGAITSLEDILERTVAIPLVKGDLLLDGKLAAKGTGRGLAAIIPSGMRAVTIQTPNVATGVAGFILPGNKVDVLLTVNSQGGDDRTGGGSTITLLQNLEILAVDQQTDVPEENKVDTKELRSVTLLATPTEAARLDLGQNKGTLRLTLRNPTDEATEFVDPVTLAGLNLNPFETRLAQQDVVPPEVVPLEMVPPVVVPPELVPTVAVAVEAPPVATPKKRFTPQIRTLRGTRAALIRIPVPESDRDEQIEEPASPLASTAP